ncbi:Uncharacterised protein [Vibrio cholerae]|nr:Uncharacterised protein [Vibrio cholerae]
MLRTKISSSSAIFSSMPGPALPTVPILSARNG